MPQSAEDAQHEMEAPALGTSSADTRVFRVELTDPGTFYRPARQQRPVHLLVFAAVIFAFAAAVLYFIPSVGAGLLLISIGSLTAASYWFVEKAVGKPAIRAVVVDPETSGISLEAADGSSVHLPRSAVDDVRVIEKSVRYKNRRRSYHRTFFVRGEIPVFGNLFLGPKVRKATTVVDACVALMEVLERVPSDAALEDCGLANAWARLGHVPQLTVRGSAPTAAWDPAQDRVDITFEPDRSDRRLVQGTAFAGLLTAILVAFGIGIGDCGNDAPVPTVLVWLGLAVGVALLRARSVLASRRRTLRVRVDGSETVIAIEKNGVEVRARRWKTSELQGIDSHPSALDGVNMLTFRDASVAELSNTHLTPRPRLDINELPLAVAIDVEVILNAAVQRVRTSARCAPSQADDAH